MNIMPISYTNQTVFKGYDEAGYDDSFFQSIRNALRLHYNNWNNIYHDVFEKEHSLTKYQLNIMIKELEKYHEMRQIDHTNIYRGQALESHPKYLNALKEKGIKTVIDLVNYGKDYQEAVEQAGLNYYMYDICDNWWNSKSIDNTHKSKLVDFLHKMQEDNIYIGCRQGINDTDVAFLLNDFFNPLLEGKEQTKIPANDCDFPIKLNTIYDLFTPEDKKLLGWTKEFEQKLIRKLISI